jgi:Ca-activated chloride channel family protein
MLWALVLVPAALAAYLWSQRRRSRYVARFTNLNLLASVIPRTPGWRRHLPAALYLLAMVGLLLALARPQATVLVPKEQATVVLVMDVSGSMDAVDVAPTRLVAAVAGAERFVDRLPDSFRVGLVTFSSTAQLVVAPTVDRQAIKDALDGLRAGGGTAIGDAIQRALGLRRPPASAPTRSSAPLARPAPDPSVTGPMVILLLSDGANTAGRTDPLIAADHARQLGVPIHTLAFGTPEGQVTVPNQAGQFSVTPVPPDPAGLAAIAERAGGQAHTAATPDSLERIYRQLGTQIGFVQQRQEITVVFAAAALLPLVVGGLLSLVWFRRFP